MLRRQRSKTCRLPSGVLPNHGSRANLTKITHGGKFAYDDDQETPNTQTASFDFGGRELVFETRGLLTGGEGFVTAPQGSAPLYIKIGSTRYLAGVMFGSLFEDCANADGFVPLYTRVATYARWIRAWIKTRP